jgi:hypothetical protein
MFICRHPAILIRVIIPMNSFPPSNFAEKFAQGPGGGSMDEAKIGGKKAGLSGSTYIPRWNAGHRRLRL